MNLVLLSTAASLGIFRTLIGVDHYIPFVAMSKSNRWSFPKTMLIVFICGFGHILSSVIVALAGIWFGAQISFLANIEDIRGEIAKWFLIAFGVVYMLWGIRNAIKNKPHRHIPDSEENADANTAASDAHRSFWPLFVLFVFAPCETLIPLLMYPAAESDVMAVISIAAVFAVCTIGTMLVCTALVLKGINMIPMQKIERYAHAIAGFAVLLSGMAILFFGI